ncbi:MAG: hypothetical protein SVZ03_01480 [Spirochaetota bacterium]|nr:hypothetical protein [Spirochaetota bacterium]
MVKIILFNELESSIIDKLLWHLKKNNKTDDISFVNNNRTALEEIARSISLYPSIMKEQQLGKGIRTIETLVESLCEKDELSIMLHIPTKAVLGNGYLIAKINFFSMLIYLTNEIQGLEDIAAQIKSIISNNVFTIMSEEVFLSIIEDNDIPKHIRMNAGYLLAKIWEYRLDHGVKEFAPILLNIWKAREKLMPAFGTMNGFSELLLISEQTESVWLDFFRRDSLSEKEISSLEEFIFGLSYEEMIQIRMQMERMGKSSITKQDVEEIIGKNRIYPEYKICDPREFYRSFEHRKINAKFRAKARTDGPHKTIEEYIMCYLLSIPEEWMGRDAM